MDKGISLFLRKLQRVSTCLVIDISVQYYLSAVSLCAVYLDQRCSGRHHDYRLAAIAFCRISDTLRMVSGGCRNQSPASLLFRQCADLIISTSHLVGSGKLHVFRLQIYLITGLYTQEITVYQLCLQCDFLHLFTGFLKLIQRQHLCFLLSQIFIFHIKQCIHKFIRIKLLQIVNGLSHTDIFHRYSKLGLDCHRNSALCRSVHLR